MKKRLSIASVALLLVAMAGGLQASSFNWFNQDTPEREMESKSEATIMVSTKISLVQAIAVAEQQTAEKAVGADLKRDRKSGTVYYRVETEGTKTGHTINVDAITGKIVKLQEDSGHHEEGHEECEREEDREEKD